MLLRFVFRFSFQTVFFLPCEWFITTQNRYKQIKDCQKIVSEQLPELFPQFPLIYSEVPVGHKNSFDGSILNNQCHAVSI